mmetsp:Transcript_41415/g.97023  ORF Transcript_41415/g.97023 Transcript_41415/m.97023 type:complete len:210 (-) Transcript_41415:207-836(-)
MDSRDRILRSSATGGAILGDELGVRGHHIDTGSDDPLYLFQVLLDLIFGQQINQRMVRPRPDALTMHDLQPANLGEQLVTLAVNTPVTFEEPHTVRQRLRDLHGAAIVPKWRVGALCSLVMQDDEVAYPFEFQRHQAVVFVAVSVVDAARREIGKQMAYAHLDQVNAGGLERLQEAAGQTDGDNVAIPRTMTFPSQELDGAGAGKRLAV